MGVFVGIFGVAFLPLTLGLEESVGLDNLFRLRGPRKVPPAVAVVTLDQISAEALGVPPDPDEWPRRLHVQLIEALVQQGVEVIAFDIIFDRPTTAEDDEALARALRRAGNVVLGQGLRQSTYSLDDERGLLRGQLNIEKLVSPAAPLARSALALAPFPLPKIPVQVSQYWRIKPEAGDVATLPVVVFQVWALEVWEDFVRLLRSAGLDPHHTLPDDKSAVMEARNIQGLIQTLRETFARHRRAVPGLLALLEEEGLDDQRKQMLQSLTRLYADGKSSHLNYYGPPGTVQTVRYSDLVRKPSLSAPAPPLPDLTGRAVFVGLSERMRPDQKDGFHTVFSLPTGVDISGVEIAASAFANLAENSPVRPFDPGIHFIFICLWGGLLGFVCLMLPPAVSAAGIAGLGAIYAALAYHQFKVNAIWFPLVLPLLFQMPLAFFGALLWKYVETNREKKNIRKAAEYYLPGHLVDRWSRSAEDILAEGQTVYGTCLITDAEQYTRLAEQLSPKQLNRFMNAYYGAIFEPVKEQGGRVSDVVGDSMLALWATSQPDASLSDKACRAALQISRAVDRFNQRSEFSPLPTRIGLHSGSMVVGTIGAGDHYEYRYVGEVVNTASRIEGLNKYLKTQILVSKEVVDQLNGFFTRELGDFILVGKSNPIRIYELIDPASDTDSARRVFYENFSKALAEFRGKRWSEAIRFFQRALEGSNKPDGPSAFYLKLCEQYKIIPPGDGWEGSVNMDRK